METQEGWLQQEAQLLYMESLEDYFPTPTGRGFQVLCGSCAVLEITSFPT